MSARKLKVKHPLIIGNEKNQLLSILSLKVDYSYWYYQQFLHLFINKDQTDEEFVDFLTAPDFDETCPCLSINKEELSSSELNDDSIMKKIKKAIDNDTYLLLSVDEYYLPPCEGYNKRHDIRELLIYGYDSMEGLFYVSGYNKERMFGYYEIRLADLTNTLTKMQGTNFMRKIRLSETALDTFDLFAFRQGLVDYLEGARPSTAAETLRGPFGINSYLFLSDYLGALVRNEKRFCIRSVQIMLEHKKTMYQRLLFLEEHSYLSQIVEVIEPFKQLSETFLILRNLLLKYEKTGDERLIRSMLSILHEAGRDEKFAVQVLLDKLHQPA